MYRTPYLYCTIVSISVFIPLPLLSVDLTWLLGSDSQQLLLLHKLMFLHHGTTPHPLFPEWQVTRPEVTRLWIPSDSLRSGVKTHPITWLCQLNNTQQYTCTMNTIHVYHYRLEHHTPQSLSPMLRWSAQSDYYHNTDSMGISLGFSHLAE